MLYDDLLKCGIGVKKYPGEFGIEIETEGKSVYKPVPMTFWTVHKDESLRGPAPYEYVLRQPLKFKHELPQAFEEFKEKTKGIDFDQSSFTTSVHVHVNMLNEKYMTMGNFLTIYSIVENLLKKYAGETRESNLFCLPLCDAEENLGNIMHILKQIRQKKFMHLNLSAADAKYAALNMCSLSKFGSLEVRLLRGVTDTEIIQEWVGMLNSILEFSRQDMSPKDVMKLWRNKGSELLSDIFGPYRKKLRFDNETALIDQNFWYAANIAMCVPDWAELDKEPPVRKTQNFKDLDAISAKLYGKKFDDLPEDLKFNIIQNYQFIDFNLENLGVKAKKKVVFDPFNVPQPAPGNIPQAPNWAQLADAIQNPVDHPFVPPPLPQEPVEPQLEEENNGDDWDNDFDEEGNL